MACHEQLFRAWEQQHDAAARSRAMAEAVTRQRLIDARIRLERAMRAVEMIAELEEPDQ